jgi:hypothetical protein
LWTIVQVCFEPWSSQFQPLWVPDTGVSQVAVLGEEFSIVIINIRSLSTESPLMPNKVGFLSEGCHICCSYSIWQFTGVCPFVLHQLTSLSFVGLPSSDNCIIYRCVQNSGERCHYFKEHISY